MKKTLTILSVIAILIVIDLSYLSEYESRFERWLNRNDFLHTSTSYSRFGNADSVIANYYCSKQSTDTLIILLHGGGNDALYPAVGFIKEILNIGYQVLTFDIDGHGKKSTSIYQSDSLLNCLNSFFANNDSYICNKKVFLVGYSLGGAVMLNSLPNLENKVEGAVAISVPLKLEIENEATSELLCVFKGAFYRQVKHYGVYGLLPALGSFKRQNYPIRIKENVDKNLEPWKNYTNYFSESFNKMHLLESVQIIHIPLLIIGGEKDKIAPVSHLKELSSFNKNSKLVILNGETHLTTFMSKSTEQEIFNWIRTNK